MVQHTHSTGGNYQLGKIIENNLFFRLKAYDIINEMNAYMGERIVFIPESCIKSDMKYMIYRNQVVNRYIEFSNDEYLPNIMKDCHIEVKRKGSDLWTSLALYDSIERMKIKV